MNPLRVVSIEDWTRGDPAEQSAEQRARRMERDLRTMAAMVARLKQIERAAEQIMLHHADGNIKPESPLACQAMVDLGHALLQRPHWRRA